MPNLLCEGACSGGLVRLSTWAPTTDATSFLASARRDASMTETKRLQCRPHRPSRVVGGHERWVCAECGHEQVWG